MQKKMSIIKRIKKKIKHELSSDEYISSLKKKGTLVGKGTIVTEPSTVRIDSGFPYCVEIGSYVTITSHVLILAHDYSYSVLNNVYNVMPQNSYNTIIGNNVFLGQRSIILPGTQIGNNVIVGAGAVVHGIIPDNTVWAGNPAKQICTLEEFKIKREKRYEEGAVILANSIIQKMHRKPSYEEMRMYIGLFCPRTEEYKHYFEALPTDLPNAKENVWKYPQKYDDLDDFLIKNKLL